MAVTSVFLIRLIDFIVFVFTTMVNFVLIFLFIVALAPELIRTLVARIASRRYADHSSR
ncbi:MAG TPA: hypothetical protein VMU65_04850 [Candidatus Saccharimonadales bacterium]|nr:hypothetical protein [Candidatus Saccharimonadales bacterium]